MYYITTDTILDAYSELISNEVKNASIFHIFLILKGCGINSTYYLPIDIIAEQGYPVAKDLSLLFAHNENKPNKYDFINPFLMKEWQKQAPSESLKKWVTSRIKNNIIGGATTWRKIIREDIYEEKIKFSHNYVTEIKELCIPNNKIKLFPLVIWFNRFNEFGRKYTPNDLISAFINELHLTDEELGVLFDRTVSIEIEYIDSPVNMEKIRNTIGAPEKVIGEEWSKSNIIEIASPQEYYNYKRKFMNKKANISIEKTCQLLEKNFQIILSGPPGTSKSYTAEAVAMKLTNNSSSILKIQFHPQYSYQDFLGGFIVNGDKVEPNKGVFLRFLEKVMKDEENTYILIIDEINRANVSSVFGELIQCLDRNYSLSSIIAGEEITLNIPKNLYIIATMNTADRTLGSIDFALKRRFIDIYIAPNEDELVDKTETECNISLADFLKKINENLRITLRNNELVVGQTIFYSEDVFHENKFYWDNNNLEDVFNYKILSIVEEYCNKEYNKISEIVGEQLADRLTGDEFIKALVEFNA